MTQRAVIVATGKLGASGAAGPAGAAGAAGDWSTAQTINTQTGTTYTLVTGDAGKLVTCSNASAITVTVGTSLDLTTGQRIDLAALGAGQVTVAAGGATLNGTPGLKLRAQYSTATLICIGTDSYLLMGDLVA
jgi:hypothetical protein